MGKGPLFNWRPGGDEHFEPQRLPTVEFQCFHCQKWTRVAAQRVGDAEAEYWKKRHDRLYGMMNDVVERAIKAESQAAKLAEACSAVPRILYGIGLDDPRQAMVAQKAIDVCRAALAGDNRTTDTAGEWIACSDMRGPSAPRKHQDVWLAVESTLDPNRFVTEAVWRGDWYITGEDGDQHVSDLWMKPFAWMARPSIPAPPLPAPPTGEKT